MRVGGVLQVKILSQALPWELCNRQRGHARFEECSGPRRDVDNGPSRVWLGLAES